MLIWRSIHLPLKTHLSLPMYFRDISVHSGRNICTQGLLYDRNGDASRFYATTDFFEDFFSNLKVFLGFDLTEKHSGNIPRNAYVACER